MVHIPDEDQPLKRDTERIARISTSISLKHRCAVSSQNHKPCAVILLLFINEGWAAAVGTDGNNLGAQIMCQSSWKRQRAYSVFSIM